MDIKFNCLSRENISEGCVTKLKGVVSGRSTVAGKSVRAISSDECPVPDEQPEPGQYSPDPPELAPAGPGRRAARLGGDATVRRPIGVAGRSGHPAQG